MNLVYRAKIKQWILRCDCVEYFFNTIEEVFDFIKEVKKW